MKDRPLLSRTIHDGQDGPHPELVRHVERHRASAFQRPIADHTAQAFSLAEDHRNRFDGPIILDSGCGTGDSSRKLALASPEALVIAVDRSEHRLHRERQAPDPDNLLRVRAELIDFYRLAAGAGWRLAEHYILYPNPYPKAAHLSRRWHASPVFGDMLRLGGHMMLRTNWKVYAEEFCLSLGVWGVTAQVTRLPSLTDEEALSPFERKYARSDHALFEVAAHLPPMDEN